MAQDPGPTRRGIRAVDLVDVLVYLTVLSLFVQFAPAVISESFLASLATAILLKLALELVVAAKTTVLGWLRSAETVLTRALSTVALMALAAGSKFVVLWLTDIVLGGAVQLGGFLDVTLLVVTLMLSRFAVRRVVQ